MKKCLAVLLMCATLLSLSACSLLALPVKQEDLHIMEPAENESAAPEKETPEASEPVTEETEPKSRFLGVTDAYYDFRTQDLFGECFHCYHIPRVEFEGEAEPAVNERIYSELYGVLENRLYSDPEYYELGGLCYVWGRNEEIVSILATTSMISYDSTNYYIYNISAETGEAATEEMVMESYGITKEDYEELLKEAIVKYFSERAETIIGFVGEDLYQDVLNKSLADVSAGTSMPFVGSNGALCAKANIYWIAGAELYVTLFDLETKQPLPGIECMGEHPA